MAKQHGFLKVQGKLDDISFFKRKNEFLLRNKGGVTKERIMNDPRYVRTRENINEFGHIAISGKSLRIALAALIRKAYDGSLSNRMMQALTKVKNTDTISGRGKRKVAVGIGTVAGLSALKGFEFNSKAPLSSVLGAEVNLNKTTGTVKIIDLIPIEQVMAPKYATHVQFRSACLRLDFETGDHEIAYSPVVNLPLDATVSSPAMTPTLLPTGSGTMMFLLLVEFFQEQAEVQYLLSNGDYNSLTLLDLD
jgi:hypothetical protein